MFNMGMSVFKSLCKEVKIKLEGKIVHVTYIMEFPDESLARKFAENFKKTYEEGV